MSTVTDLALLAVMVGGTYFAWKEGYIDQLLAKLRELGSNLGGSTPTNTSSPAPVGGSTCRNQVGICPTDKSKYIWLDNKCYTQDQVVALTLQFTKDHPCPAAQTYDICKKKCVQSQYLSSRAEAQEIRITLA